MEEDMDVSAPGLTAQMSNRSSVPSPESDQISTPNLAPEGREPAPEGRGPYRICSHAVKAFQTLNTLRKEGLLCDVIIVADGVEIPAHRTVLAACSPYFCAMFTGNLAESRSERIEIREVDSMALSMLIGFMYTSEIQIAEDNVQIILQVANLLHLNDVTDLCCDFLSSKLHPLNCLGIKAFADMHGCLELHHMAQMYTEQNFSDVVQNEEFLSSTAEQVCKLIASDQLTVVSEEQVFEAVISWVGHDSSRQPFLSMLMEHVRLPLLTREYLVSRVGEDHLVKGNSQCKDLLIEAMKYHLLKGDQQVLVKTHRTKPRKPIGLPKIMLVMGGQAPKAIRSVEVYDFKEEKWSQAADMPSRRCRCGVAVLNNTVYAIGGFNGSLRVRTVDAYDPTKDSWSNVASMEARRSTLGAAVLNGCVYAVGGFDGSSGLNSVESYDPKKNEWKLVAPMSTRRSSVGVGVVAGLLYAVGGYDGASRHCLSSVECYNPETDAWKAVAEMSCKRSGAGVGVFGGLLYAVGGHDGPLVRKSVEVYNPETKQWSQVVNMHRCRRNAGVIAHDGLLFVIGGDDGCCNLASVEYYDPKQDNWILLPVKMTTGRSYAGVAAIDKPL